VISLPEHDVEIPPGLGDLQRFREWLHSPGFPVTGRIDWILGRLEVDMSPEDLNTHGSPKSAIAGVLVARIQEQDRGMVFIDRARLSHREADLSAEPDIVAILFETTRAGDARLVPKASAQEGRFIEIEGRVDLVVECVSDSSEKKDKKQLLEAYWLAGIPEYWLVDARTQDPSFVVFRRTEGGYRPASAGGAGFQHSELLRAEVRLVRRRQEGDFVVFRLEVREG
jgi:Uma2 family endonuclease